MVAIKEQLFCRQGDKVYVQDLLVEGCPSTSVRPAVPDVPPPPQQEQQEQQAGGPLHALRRSNRDGFEKRHKELLQQFEDITSDAAQVQEQVRTHILAANSGAEYLHTFGLHGRTDLEGFRTLPVVQYKDIEAHIRRVVIHGDEGPVLSVQPPVEVLCSSATSGGACKLFPAVEGDAERRAVAESLATALLLRDLPGLDQGKCLYFFFCKEPTPLPSGLPCHNVVSADYRHPAFKQRLFSDPSFQLTSPHEVVLATDAQQALYCHLLLGLVQSQEVLRIGAVFASVFIRAVTFLEEVWQELCEDIATGTVGGRVTDPPLRDACTQIVNKPDAGLAAAVRAACAGGIGEGIIPRLWPNVKVIDVVTTGSMEAYIPYLKAFGGGVPVVCGQLYGASECYMGVNTQPLSPPDAVSYTFLPNMAYYEFLPLEQAAAHGPLEHKLVPLSDVEVGQEYELVVTTYAGLYRFRVGDILRCTGRYNQAPHFYFVARAGVALSVASEKTTDQELHHAVTQASRHLQAAGMHLRDYTSYSDSSSRPGHYIIFWEVAEKDPNIDSQLLEQCCSTMDNDLGASYCSLRKDGFVGPLELRIVQGGTFNQLASLAISQGSSLAQYKTPRSLKQQAMVDLMNACVCRAQRAMQHRENNLPA